MATDDDSDVPESGGVFTFGKSKFADNVPSKFWVRNDPVAEVACGDEHTALVAESGRIFTFGANDWGQLGLGDGKQRTKPSCIKSLKSEKIRSVACGRSTTYVATESGRVYSCGGNSESQLGQGVNDASVNKPAMVEGLPSIKVKMLSAGADHVALLTEDGKLYMWGGGSEGQLGLGKEEECPVPKLLDVDEAITCVSCGYYHTAFTTESGALYTFGESENGKLGLGEDPENTNWPQKVAGIPGRVRTVACGGSHTVAVTTDGKVYTFGDGSNGQLGHGNIQLQATTPQEIMSLRETKIHAASCGENHTALISFKGVLFTFGDGRHGKLGLGEENFANQFKPSAVTRFGAFTVERVACGGCHMLVLARPKLQNGDVSASDSDEPVEEEPKPMKQLELLRRSDDMDLSGSFSARNRRREKQRQQDPSASMSRTLPPLNSSIGGRVLPPLSSTMGASIDNPLNKSMLPPLKKPGESSSEEKREESTESEESKLKKLEETEEDSEESEPKRTAIRPATQSLAKASPVPRPRFGTKVKPAAKTDSEEETDSEDTKKKVEKKTEKPSFRKHESESEDEEEDSKKKKEKDKKKEVEKKNSKSRAKKRGGLFGKKNYLESDDEDEKEESESESEESSEMDQKVKGKKKEEESEDDESDKKKNNVNKKVQSKSEEEESSGDKEEEKKSKEKEEEPKPLVKKKSKLCVIL